MTSTEARQVFLPKFSDKKDIAEFVEKLEAFERGDLTSDQFRTFRLLRGVYGQRQMDVQMLRIKIPFGRLGPDQLRVVADIADKYSRGFGHVTTRQNIQLHFVKLANAESSLDMLDTVGLTTREACGNSVRTVTACELTEVCSGSAFDVTPYAEAMTRHFLRHPLSGSLPRKFKIAFSGCGSDCAFGAIHDIGFIAQVRDGQRGFKVFCAGGLSTTPQAAIVLHEFVPAGEMGRVGEALVRLFHALGNRDNKARARMKYVLRKQGEEGFRAKYAEYRAQVDAEAMKELALPEQPHNTPAPAVDEVQGKTPEGYLAWRATNVIDQKQDGFVAAYVRLFLGDITSVQMRQLADLLGRFGDGTIRLTVDQNILIPWVDKKSVPSLYAALRAIGLGLGDAHHAGDVTSCPGAESCNLAVTSSRNVAKAISERLDKSDVSAASAMKDTVIKISGCPNSCGQHHIADIGWHGAAKTVNGTTYPMYQLHLGGGVDERGARFGRQVVKVVAKRVPEAVALLVKLFETDKTEGETPAAFFQRVDAKRVVAALGDVASLAPAGDESVDIGEDAGFHVAIGAGECAA
ncbi:MAG TPA: nitrite/sulfite reductase [Polyangiaceae bacterium]|jgi:sulfite reductase beta subunit-like hemoprotein|nr:nitrite/sulfite reductase [Polyangiaceae bacterium]